MYLSRLTVLCTVHALCVATVVQAIVLQVFLVAQECGFRLPTDHTISPSLSLHPELAKFLVEFAVPGSFRAQLLISSSCFPRVHRTASITRFAAHALWVITPPRVSPGFTGQRLSLDLQPTHCWYFRLLVFPQGSEDSVTFF